MIYVVILYFLALFIYSQKHKSWGIFSYLVAVYLFSLFVSLGMIYSNDDYKSYTESFVPSLVFCVGLSILFFPYLRQKPSLSFPASSPRFVKMFKQVGYSISLLFIVGMVLVLPSIVLALAVGAYDIRVENVDFISNLSRIPRYFAYFLYYFNGVSYILIILFFYSLINIKDKLLTILLLLASLAAPYMGVLVGGRTNLIYWVLFFLFCLVLFYPYLEAKKKKRMFLPLVVLFGLMTVYFITTSESRFEDSDLGTMGSIEKYAGQIYINFCRYFRDIDFSNFTLRRVLPLTSSLFSGSFDLLEYREEVASATGLDIGVFYTLLGDLYIDLGLIGMFVYCIIYAFITNKLLRHNSLSVERVIYLGILFQIPLHGLFYYSLWTTRATLSIIVSLIIAKLLKNASNANITQ